MVNIRYKTTRSGKDRRKKTQKLDIPTLEWAIGAVCFYCQQGVKFETPDFHYPGDYHCPATSLRCERERLKGLEGK